MVPAMTQRGQSQTLLKIQTVSIVGLLLIAIGGVIAYGCQRKRESDRLDAMRNYNCGRSSSAVLIEAQGLWDDLKVIRSAAPANGLAPGRLASFDQRLKDLTGQHLAGVEASCDSETVKRITDTVRTRYPGLTTW